jgi:hypothetical protein
MSKGRINDFVHPGGRPTKYEGEKTLEKLRAYIDSCVDGYEEFVTHLKKVKGKGKQKAKTVQMLERKFRVRLPMLEGVALALDIQVPTIQEWRKQYPEFSSLIAKVLQLQAQRLAENSLTGLYNPTIAKVLLSKHGYREGHELANPDGSNLFRPDDKDREIADRALEDIE